MRPLAASILISLALVLANRPASAVPGEIVYQGNLLENGVPANGLVSLHLAIFDSAQGGTRRWQEDHPTVPVTSGIFTVVLGSSTPFPQGLFDGARRWIETTVNGEVLAPRAELLTVPYAVTAESAETGGESLWQTNGTDVYRLTGNVGVGTTTPEYPLDVEGEIHARTFSTDSQPIGNGGGLADLRHDHLTFRGSYGYGVGDQYVEFQSGFNPQIGGQGLLARLTAYRTPEGYDSGEGKLKVTLREGSGVVDALRIDRWGITTAARELGNGSSAANLLSNGLVFDGSYGYGVGDEFIQFNAGFNPQIGGQGPMARLTAFRSPEGYDLGEGKLRISLRQGATLADALTVTSNPASRLEVTGVVHATAGGFRFPDGTLQTTAAAGGVTGGGTPDYLPKFTGATTLGNSVIQEAGGNIGIGMASPAAKLDVGGTARITTVAGSWAMNVSNTQTTGTTQGLYATTASPATEAAVKGAAWTGSGNTTGVLGVIDSPGVQGGPGNPAAVYGWATFDGPGDAYGVLGRCKTHLSAPGGGWDAPAGVFGWATSPTGLSWGVWGENKSATDGTAGVRGLAVPATGEIYGVEGETNSPSGLGVHAIGGIGAAGIIATEVETSKGTSFLYAVASTANWFEDFGSGTLESGEARIELDPAFLETVDVQAPEDLKVFLTPTSEGIAGRLVVLKGARGFTVREQGAEARSSGTFDYRVVAPRKGYRGIRLAAVDAPRPDLAHARRGLFNEGHASDPEGDRRILTRD